MVTKKFTGIIPAVFTPFDPNGDLDLPMIPRIIDRLTDSGARSLFVLGSSGESPSLTTSERKKVAESYQEAAAGKAQVILHVGHNCLREARDLAVHAELLAVDAISAVSPSYFRPGSVEALCDCMAEIASAAPGTPFFFYHLPGVTGVDFDTVELTGRLVERIPTLTGIKFSKPDLATFRSCLDHAPAHLDVLWGCDEMYLPALSVGARGAVGTTFNYLLPLYRRITDEFERGDIEGAGRLQGKAVEMIRLIFKHTGRGGLKAVMAFTGLDVGPHRLPLLDPTETQLSALRADLERAGFYEWASLAEDGLSRESLRA